MSSQSEQGKTEEGEKFPDLRFGPYDYSLKCITSYLTPAQTESLKQFRESLPEIWPEPWQGIEKLFLSDSTLCRYLRARDWNLSKAQKMIVDTLTWRREYKPWALTAQDIDIELNNEGKLYRSGFDKYQRPIIIMKPRKDNTGTEIKDVKIKALVWWLEKCVRAGEANDREKISLLIDFSKHAGAASISNIKMSLEVLSILSNHYPERLGTAWIIHASWSFTFFWKAVSPFLDAVTTKKIFFIKKLDEFKAWIEDDILEEEYGGNSKYQYNYEEHKVLQDKLFPPYNEDGELVPLYIEEGANGSAKGETKKKKKKQKKVEETKSNDAEESSSTTHNTEESKDAEEQPQQSEKKPKTKDNKASEEDSSEQASKEQVVEEGSKQKEEPKKKKKMSAEDPNGDAKARESEE